MTDCSPVAHDLAQRRLADTLRLYVGRGKRYSVVLLADATQIPDRTIKSYVEGAATPGFANLLTLIAVLGPVFASALLAPAGVSGVTMQGDGDCCPHHSASVQAASLARLLVALEDGTIDHTERPGVIRSCRETISALSALVAALEAK